MALVKEVRPLPTFEDDYAKYVERKAKVEEDVKAEFEAILAERTRVLDELINLVSETVEVEVPDEETVVEETTGEIVGGN